MHVNTHGGENTQTLTYTHTQEREHTDMHTHTHNRGTTQTLTHRQAYTHRGVRTQQREHTRAHKQYTVKGVCTQGREHTDTYTQMCTHTHTLRNEYAAERTQAFQKYGNKCYLKNKKRTQKRIKERKKQNPSTISGNCSCGDKGQHHLLSVKLVPLWSKSSC